MAYRNNSSINASRSHHRQGTDVQRKMKVELSEMEIEELKEAFELFDRDGDQRIAARELHVVMQAIGRNVTIDDTRVMIRETKMQTFAEVETPASRSRAKRQK